jgi:SAM-dependent methyltransferase
MLNRIVGFAHCDLLMADGARCAAMQDYGSTGCFGKIPTVAKQVTTGRGPEKRSRCYDDYLGIIDMSVDVVQYDAEFYDTWSPGSLRSARVIVPKVLEYVAIRSAVDVGCGSGAWLRALEECGVYDVVGYDGDYVDRSKLLIDREKFTPVNLATELPVNRTFDIAISLEVAEHLASELAEAFIGRLVALAPVVLFSAAIPGQGGTAHINEQWQDYWRSLFKSFNFHPVDLIRPMIWDDSDVEYWYQQNILLYCNEEHVRHNSNLQKVSDHLSLNLVHPMTYESLLSRAHLYRSGEHLRLKETLRLLPRVTRTAVARRLKRISYLHMHF